MCFDLLKHGQTQLTNAEAKKKYLQAYACHTAFANNHGYNCNQNRHGPFADFVGGHDLGAELPTLDKVRICGGATIKGVVVGTMLKVETLRGAIPIAELLEKPWLYFAAIASGEQPFIFPVGKGYPIYIPLISNQDVYFPLNQLEQVSAISDPLYVP